MGDYYKPFARSIPKPAPLRPFIAYDFETTNIPSRVTDEMTVKPKYIALFTKEWNDARPLNGYGDILTLLRDLWPRVANGSRFVAYNANRFDLRIIMQALLGSEFTCEPFISKVSGLRGAVIRRGYKRTLWLDPIAMLGLSCSLRDFQSVFAPAFPKGRLNFEQTPFDATNPAHVEYAKRDAEALYWGMVKAESVVKKITGLPLQSTIGSLGIKTFASRMPKGVMVPALTPEVFTIVRRQLARGGYVVARPYRGKLWTYDLNQAYAHAMRRCLLPSGRALPATALPSSGAFFLYGRIARTTPSPVPYLVRGPAPTYKLTETYGEGISAWLTCDELQCLRRHGWDVTPLTVYAFEGSFTMARFVNSLEARRRTFPKNHPVNLLCKNIGNNAYGKTLQEATEWRYVMAEKCPKGGVHVNEDSETGEPIRGLWIVPESKDTRRCYERPQIGAFITAFIRCVLYDAIMADPEHFVKADTDSVSFTRPQKLPVSSWQYGKWKVESAGAFHIVIAKKVYWTAKHTVCKGLRTKGMGRRLFERWSLGEIPVQTQIQLVSWKKGVAPSWRVQRRRGTHL